MVEWITGLCETRTIISCGSYLGFYLLFQSPRTNVLWTLRYFCLRQCQHVVRNIVCASSLPGSATSVPVPSLPSPAVSTRPSHTAVHTPAPFSYFCLVGLSLATKSLLIRHWMWYLLWFLLSWSQRRFLLRVSGDVIACTYEGRPSLPCNWIHLIGHV